jgi:TRAP-type C4-dicarboxylate transport system substrate-binding protein
MQLTRLIRFNKNATTLFARYAAIGMVSVTTWVLACIFASLSLGSEVAAETRKFRFAYDQPRNTGYSVAADVFAGKIAELSKGAFVIEQYPGAQLGQEPQVLQLLKSGDLDFAITSSANTATLSPQAGAFSLHFLFRSEDHLTKALANEQVSKAVRYMIDDTVQGVHVLALCSLGFRDMYSKREIHKLEDITGLKVRVQATATEDTMFPAYAAQTVHMPFGSVYTSLQTGVVDVAENGINVYLVLAQSGRWETCRERNAHSWAHDLPIFVVRVSGRPGGILIDGRRLRWHVGHRSHVRHDYPEDV